MTQIDSTGRLAAIIRRQVTSLARTEGRGAASGRPETASQQSTSPTNEAGAPKDVAALVPRRVQAIDPDDPGRHRKAFRVFLESVLLEQFGTHLVNDPGFHQLVDDVHVQMEGDEALASAMQEATNAMLGSASGSAARG